MLWEYDVYINRLLALFKLLCCYYLLLLLLLLLLMLLLLLLLLLFGLWDQTVTCFAIILPIILCGWGQEGGTGAREKRGRRREKRAHEVGVQRWREPGEIEKVSQHVVIFCNRNRTNRREPLQKEAESGSKSYGKRE